jgi:dienelactone hydrolase
VSLLEAVLIIAALAAGLWWALSRRRQLAALEALSAAALVLALIALIVDGVQWQLVPWQVLAVAVAVAAALRRWRPGHSRRWRRVSGRVVLVLGLMVGGLALLTAFVPTLPKPSGQHRVGSVTFRWTDQKRAETLTAMAGDRRQVVAQAWYPTDATTGADVPYFEAQGHLPRSIGGLPSFMFASFGKVATHATQNSRVSTAQATWPVLLFSPGLTVPREEYSALCAELASRGYIVVALSAPYESGVTELAGGRVVGQTTHPNVMGPAPHPAIERLIDIRVADNSFVLDQLTRLGQISPDSPLTGHLDLSNVGMLGHSVGGATAVGVMASDARVKVGVNLDGKLFGAERTTPLKGSFLWIESGDAKTTEYTQGQNSFFAALRGGGEVLNVNNSVHMSFTDTPAYTTALGRSLFGSLASGSQSVATMTAITGDTVAAFVGPTLGVKNSLSLKQVLAAHPTLTAVRRVAPRVSS